jgi:hypothetical protein
MPVPMAEIVRSEWTDALQSFSAIHEGWLVSLDIVSAAVGVQRVVTNLPLLGTTFEPAGAGMILMDVGQSLTGRTTHAISSPRRVWIERTEAGNDAALAIESAGGTKTILRLKTPAAPETVDGKWRSAR